MKRRRLEAIFWAMELLDSMEGLSILEILMECWFSSAPYTWTLGLALLELAAKEEMDGEELLQMVHASAAVVERDASVFWLLSQGCQAWEKQPDFVGGVAIPSEFQDTEPEIQCFVRALLQGKSLFAFTLVRHAWSEETWVTLQACAKMKGVCEDVLKLLERLAAGEVPGVFQWESRALGILLVANSQKVSRGRHAPVLKLELGADILEKKAEWEGAEGRRKRRALRINTEAILWGCARSLQKNTETNVEEIREPFHALKGGTYWETVAVEMGGWRRIAKSDDHKEVFYDLYFPDDIPDEWSAEDQEKSHGRGVLIGSLTADGQYCKWLRCFYLGSASNGLQSLTKKAAGVCLGREGWSKVYGEKKAEWTERFKTWRLTPVKKKILLLQ